MMMKFTKRFKSVFRNVSGDADWLMRNQYVFETYKDIVENILYNYIVENITREAMLQTHQFIFKEDFSTITIEMLINDATGDYRDS